MYLIEKQKNERGLLMKLRIQIGAIC